MSPPPAAPITVLIVDDHAIARLGLRAMLEADPGLQVVGEAANGPEALQRAEELAPAVVLLDARLPGMDGVEAIRRLKDRFSDIVVVLIANYDKEVLVVEAVPAGAGGYLLKDTSHELLRLAIRAAVGGFLVAAPLLRRAVGAPAAPLSRPVRAARLGLGERDLVILRRMAEGQTNREIAAALGVAEVTVKKHVQGIVAKLGAADRTHATVAALRQGLIS